MKAVWNLTFLLLSQVPDLCLAELTSGKIENQLGFCWTLISREYCFAIKELLALFCLDGGVSFLRLLPPWRVSFVINCLRALMGSGHLYATKNMLSWGHIGLSPGLLLLFEHFLKLLSFVLLYLYTARAFKHQVFFLPKLILQFQDLIF